MASKAKTAAVIVFFVLAFGIVGRLDKEDAERTEQSRKEWRVEEDSPFWNCATMGNYHCGRP